MLPQRMPQVFASSPVPVVKSGEPHSGPHRLMQPLRGAAVIAALHRDGDPLKMMGRGRNRVGSAQVTCRMGNVEDHELAGAIGRQRPVRTGEIKAAAVRCFLHHLHTGEGQRIGALGAPAFGKQRQAHRVAGIEL